MGLDAYHREGPRRGLSDRLHRDGPRDGCGGCGSSGQVDQATISKEDTMPEDHVSEARPTTLWRVVSPQLSEARWFEDEGLLLEAFSYGADVFEDAVIHKLDLNLNPPGRYRWSRLVFKAPESRGRLVVADTE